MSRPPDNQNQNGCIACSVDRVGHRLEGSNSQAKSVPVPPRILVCVCLLRCVYFVYLGTVCSTLLHTHTKSNETLIRYHAACATERLPGAGGTRIGAGGLCKEAEAT